MEITINGIHESEYEFYSELVARPIYPNEKASTQDISTRDGEFDFSSFNPDGRKHFKNRTIEIKIYFEGESYYNMPLRANRLLRWISRDVNDVVFNDMPSIIWKGKWRNKTDVLRLANTLNAVVIQFDCEPVNTLEFDTKGPKLSAKIPIGTRIPLDNYNLYKFNIQEKQTVFIKNYGDWYIKPMIKVSGNFVSISFSCGDKTLHISNNHGYAEMLIDCLHERIVAGGENITVISSGDFIEIAPFGSNVNIEGVGLNCAVTFDFNYKYIFGGEPIL